MNVRVSHGGLRRLLERLIAVDPAFETINEMDIAALDDEELERRARAGWLHRAEAAILARSAITSGNPAYVEQAYTLLQSFERQGGEMAAHVQRSAGGNTAAQKAREKLDLEWRPRIERYQELLASGMKPAAARRQIERDFKLFDISEKTIRRRLRQKTLPAPGRCKQ